MRVKWWIQGKAAKGSAKGLRESQPKPHAPSVHLHGFELSLLLLANPIGVSLDLLVALVDQSIQEHHQFVLVAGLVLLLQWRRW